MYHSGCDGAADSVANPSPGHLPSKLGARCRDLVRGYPSDYTVGRTDEGCCSGCVRTLTSRVVGGDDRDRGLELSEYPVDEGGGLAADQGRELGPRRGGFWRRDCCYRSQIRRDDCMMLFFHTRSVLVCGVCYFLPSPGAAVSSKRMVFKCSRLQS